MFTIEERIKEYLFNKSCNGALMITGPWGCGKTYYLNNKIKPYIEENTDYKVITLSLYGISKTSDISEAIYIEIQKENSPFLSSYLNNQSIVAKTVIKDIIGKTKTNYSAKDIINLYRCLDSQNLLLVFEDLDRNVIDTNAADVYGYINSLSVEDGIKVVLISNDKEINSKKYEQFKEKTVIETIPFCRQNKAVVEEIIKEFNYEPFNNLLFPKYNNNDNIDFCNMIMDLYQNDQINYRLFKYALQKTKELFSNTKKEFKINSDFLASVTLGNISLIRNTSKKDLKWDTKGLTSTTLGTPKHPCFKFAFEYIIYNLYSPEDVEKAQSDYLLSEKEKKDNKIVDEILNGISSFLTSTDDEVLYLLSKLKECLQNDKLIPFGKYGNIINYLIFIQSIIPNSKEIIDNCISRMKKNAEKNKSTINDISIYSGIQLEDEKDIKRMNDLIDEFNSIIKSDGKEELMSKIDINSFDKLCEYIEDNHSSFIHKRAFVSLLDADGLVETIKRANSNQISSFRRCLLYVYNFNNLSDYFSSDKTRIEYLIQQLISLDNDFDCIKKTQIKYLIENLKTILERL